MKNSRKDFIISLLVVIALLVIGGAYFYTNKSVGTSASADWNTFTESEYGFTFKYPTNMFVVKSGYGDGEGWWFVTQEEKGPVFGFEDTCNGAKDYLNVNADKDFTAHSVGTRYQKKNSDEYLAVLEYNIGEPKYDVTKGNQRIVKFDDLSQYGKRAVFFNGKTVVDMSYQKCAGEPIQFDDIFSTFKFI